MSRSSAPAAHSSTWCSSTPATSSASPTLITPSTTPYASRLVHRRPRLLARGDDDEGAPGGGVEVRRGLRGDERVQRYFCNFGLNPAHEAELLEGGLAVTGRDADGEARVVELPGHPFSVATLYMPQTSSTADAPHLLVGAFLAAAGARGGPLHPLPGAGWSRPGQGMRARAPPRTTPRFLQPRSSLAASGRSHQTISRRVYNSWCPPCSIGQKSRGRSDRRLALSSPSGQTPITSELRCLR